MLQLEVLILKLVAIDGFATSAIVVGKVTTLAHELGDNAMEDASSVSVSFLPSAEGTEVLCSLWDNISSQL